VSNESQLQVSRKDDESSLILSSARSSINGGAIIDHEAPGERRFVEVGK
jgi:hypothetical protein